MNHIDISGKKYGRLTTLEYVGSSKWLCECDCGTQKIIRKDSLIQGKSKSCGCLHKENAAAQIRERSVKHGDFGTKLYGVWAAIKRRCYNQNSRYYHEYGGRGITVCDRWKDDYSYFKEWSLAHDYKEGLSIDRVDTNGNYSPDNCRWVSMKEQQNNRRNNIKLAYEGKEYTLRELSDISGISFRTLKGRHERGWSIENMLDPIMHVNKYK